VLLWAVGLQLRHRDDCGLRQRRFGPSCVEPSPCQILSVAQQRIPASLRTPDRRGVRSRLKFTEEVVDRLYFGDESKEFWVMLRRAHTENLRARTVRISERPVKVRRASVRSRSSLRSLTEPASPLFTTSTHLHEQDRASDDEGADESADYDVAANDERDRQRGAERNNDPAQYPQRSSRAAGIHNTMIVTKCHAEASVP